LKLAGVINFFIMLSSILCLIFSHKKKQPPELNAAHKSDKCFGGFRRNPDVLS